MALTGQDLYKLLISLENEKIFKLISDIKMALSARDLYNLVKSFENEQIFNKFLETNDINIRSTDGHLTLLTVALMYSDDLYTGNYRNCWDVKAIKRLLDNGIDVDAKTAFGRSVLDENEVFFSINKCSKTYILFKMLIICGAKPSEDKDLSYYLCDAASAILITECDLSQYFTKIYVYDVECAFVLDVMLATFY